MTHKESQKFYESKEWRRLRKIVLKMDKYECQECKTVGRYTKATTVHHVNHLRDKPDMALNIFDELGNRNLISVCKSCHETVCHPERMREIKINQWAVDIPELIE